MIEQYRKCINVAYDGLKWRISCKLGLWSVEAPTPRENAEREAFHYWQQYHSDGEYSGLLSENLTTY